MAKFQKSENACGDAFTMMSKKPEVTPLATDMDCMKQSLRKILDLNPAWLACGHGVPVRFEEAKKVIEEYFKG